MEGHTTITSLHPDGEPKSPKGAKTTVVNQCGYYVKEHIPISFKLWKKNKVTDSDADIIPDTEKANVMGRFEMTLQCSRGEQRTI